jgi:hypothetical protein
MQIARQHDEFVADFQRTIDNLSRSLNPPPEPPYIPPPDEKSGRLGDPNFDPAEMGKAAVRWR